MNIAFVAQPWHELHPLRRRGSLGIWTSEVVERLTPANRVVVYSPGKSDHRLRSVDHDGAEYVYIPKTWMRATETVDRVLRRVRHPLGGDSTRLPSFARMTSYLGYILWIAWDLRRRNCDIVHVHNFSQFIPIIRMLNPDVRTVLHMHCDWLNQVDHATIAGRLKRTDLVIGCSDHVSSGVRDAHPEYDRRITTVYNGVDTQAFTCAPSTRHSDSKDPSREDVFRLLFVSRVSPEKGVHVLLRAMIRLQDVVPNIKLTIVGGHYPVPYEYLVGVSDDPIVRSLHRFYASERRRRCMYREHLERVVRLKLPDTVDFVGRIPHEEITSYYQKSDVLVAPSLSEAFGMPVVEAMAAGLPVVAARTGGLTEIIINNQTGRIVAPDNSRQLADAILELYQSPSLRCAMGEAGRLRVRECFDWDRVVQRLLEAYEVAFSGASDAQIPSFMNDETRVQVSSFDS
ncbi:hypothetical protein CRI94_16675 [Longibacter salinarum]|uniref:Glycosyl transferase family 1 n=1 Tax=Longibacter salinarum TaxID=1850348 RepID=A0A2A8CTV9_9BACT|nr:glycosyltransferase family 4 protein [Longibacter salinarum]PEN11216.1 hypothetical protein CRI94_16675 [Longibacter salinarum]